MRRAVSDQGMTFPPSRDLALVDLFNVGPAAKTDRDYEDLLDLAGELIRRAVGKPPSATTIEVGCRLYGGFTNVRGDPTEQHARTLKKLRRLRSVQDGVRILPEIARSLGCMPNAVLSGTYKNGGQKMVDQMLAHDVYHFAGTRQYERIVLVADDDDYIPAIISTGLKTTVELLWLRRRATGLNDEIVPTNVVLLTDGAWTR